jgi:protein-disulfide isomerase
MPLDSLHPNARPVHIAAECADEQGEFWDYHDVLFESQGQWQRLSSSELSSTLVGYASDLRMDTASFESCLSSSEIADEVNKDLLDARSYGATGTPTFFVGNEKDGFEKMVGAQPFEAFKLKIDKLLT